MRNRWIYLVQTSNRFLEKNLDLTYYFRKYKRVKLLRQIFNMYKTREEKSEGRKSKR